MAHRVLKALFPKASVRIDRLVVESRIAVRLEKGTCLVVADRTRCEGGRGSYRTLVRYRRLVSVRDSALVLIASQEEEEAV